MGLPEKDRKDDMNLEGSKKGPSKPAKSSPSDKKGEANEPISPEIIFTEMDAYQKELDQEWDKAKESYQEKIDEIMSDFLKKKGLDPETPKEKAPEPEPPAPDQTQEAKDRRSFEEMVKDLRESLKGAEPEPRGLVFKKSWVPTVRAPRLIPDARLVKKGFPWALSLLSGLLALGGLAWFITVGPKTPLPYTHAATLLVEKDQIIITDWFRKTLYFHEKRRGLPIRSVENLPNDFLSGLFFQEGFPRTINGLTGELYLHSETEDHRVLEERTLPGTEMAGAWFDGQNLWTADNDGKKIYEIHGGDLREVVQSFPFQKGKITALQFHENRLWTMDRDTREIRVFRLENPLRLLASFDLDPFLKGAKPASFFVEKNKVWLLTEDPVALRQVSRKNLEKALPTEF